MAKETAEQKLLRLIEQGGAENAPGSAAPSSLPSADAKETLNAVQSVGGAFALPNVFTQISSVCERMFHLSFQKGFGIREINKILMAATVCMACVFFMNITGGLRAAHQGVHFKDPKLVKASVEDAIPKFADLQRYLEAVSLRNIFNPFEKKEAEAVAAQSPNAVNVERIDERTRTLKLVGVSWLETPETASAMVENVGSGVTYFLRRGEQVNGVTVESIYEDSIVLEFQGERLELKL